MARGDQGWAWTGPGPGPAKGVILATFAFSVHGEESKLGFYTQQSSHRRTLLSHHRLELTMYAGGFGTWYGSDVTLSGNSQTEESSIDSDNEGTSPPGTLGTPTWHDPTITVIRQQDLGRRYTLNSLHDYLQRRRVDVAWGDGWRSFIIFSSYHFGRFPRHFRRVLRRPPQETQENILEGSTDGDTDTDSCGSL